MTNIVKEQLLKKINSSDINIHAVEKKAGLKTGSLRNIIIGRSVNPGVYTVLAACKALDCSLSEIIEYNPNPTTEDRNNIPWDKKLYEKILQQVSDNFKNFETPATLKRIQTYTEEIYVYSLHHNNGKFDKNFAQWLLKKENL